MTALFNAGPDYNQVGPRNRQWIRNIRGYAFATDPFMVDATTAPDHVYDGKTAKVLEPGTVMAQITATGLVGPYDPAAGDGREDPANIVGINNTFLATELNDGNHSITCVTANVTAYESVVIEHNAGAPLQIQPATMAAMQTVSLDILFTA